MHQLTELVLCLYSFQHFLLFLCCLIFFCLWHVLLHLVARNRLFRNICQLSCAFTTVLFFAYLVCCFSKPPIFFLSFTGLLFICAQFENHLPFLDAKSSFNNDGGVCDYGRRRWEYTCFLNLVSWTRRTNRIKQFFVKTILNDRKNCCQCGFNCKHVEQ